MTSKSNIGYAVMLHGGAGARAGRDYSEAEAHLKELAQWASKELWAGGSALDVVTRIVAKMERSGKYVAGRGSAPNSAGYVEMDASVMSGPGQKAGAVAVISDVVSPVTVARQVMENTDHVMLAGPGALAFARSQGAELVENPDDYYVLPVGALKEEVHGGHGTVGAVALDLKGRLAGATSTGGTYGKLEGRVGDSPLIGPGTWADDSIAISCTGAGEQFIRSGGAAAVAWRYRSGLSLNDSVNGMLDDVKRMGGDGGLIAVTAKGEMAAVYNSEGMKCSSASTREPASAKTFW
ncbi:MAG: isoaspartyl peptidase/L-asparaginase [Xanthomonadales bacterium]|nr:isoaspartyl peptidase/L-asparaginase [Xanthomonadales bacterium]